jgi:hypothetical protein
MRGWIALAGLMLIVPIAASAQGVTDIPAAIVDLQTRVRALEQRLATRPLATQRARGLRIQGNGDSVSEPFALDEGTAIFTIRMQGEGNKAIDLLSAPGSRASEFAALLFPRSEPYQGTVAEPIFSAGEYVLEVAAEGPWVVIVEQ